MAAPLYREMIAAYDRGDHVAARQLQANSIDLIRTFQRFGFSASAKAAMSLLGIDCGAVRPPLRNLTPVERNDLRADLERIPCWDMILQANV